MTEVRDVIIIGSGPAGYTAALYAARANLRPLVYAGYQYGGQLMLTTDVENFPGFPEGIQGPDLMAAMRAQAERFGAEMRDQDVTSVDLSRRPFVVHADNKEEEAQAIIVATGASATWLDIPGEGEYRGHGVSSCATCDGFFFRNKRMVVVGGGDVALEEALFLSRFASELTLVHRRDTFRASKAMQDRVSANERITVLWNTVIEEVIGEKDAQTGQPHVTRLRVRHVENGSESTLETDALFVAIGHHPNTEVFGDSFPVDERGYAVGRSHEETLTDIDGLFVAGDVRDYRYRQAVTAAADGCKAAMDVEKWLEAQGTEIDPTGEVYAGLTDEPAPEMRGRGV